MTAPALVIMLSIDGLGASYVDDRALELPALRGLAARGTRARRLSAIFPTVTWPCHTSIVTGVSPARHGVVGNIVFDRARGVPVEHLGDRTTAPIIGETLWDRLHARGERTATICWPKTRGVSVIPDNIPEFWTRSPCCRSRRPPPGYWAWICRLPRRRRSSRRSTMGRRLLDPAPRSRTSRAWAVLLGGGGPEPSAARSATGRAGTADGAAVPRGRRKGGEAPRRGSG